MQTQTEAEEKRKGSLFIVRDTDREREMMRRTEVRRSLKCSEMNYNLCASLL